MTPFFAVIKWWAHGQWLHEDCEAPSGAIPKKVVVKLWCEQILESTLMNIRLKLYSQECSSD